ncbi:hypothetical protein [Agrobacterium rosae]|uniref:Scaffolding protein n=1 Tax=Agrobacterium rosae TaxID=1972867 RepID=A0A1R3TUD2_9HYPH|nr:hypothetical protein [Agrobacterium rosae]SCX19672.1 hypothetical protein DSM25559_1878 [Agrobacterium rosae]
MEDANTSVETGLTLEEAATEIESLLDFGADTETTDDSIDENTTLETTDEVVDEQPETDSETDEEVEEDTNTDAENTVSDETKVKLSDGEELTLGDLKKGYLRQADYTKKTQELAAERAELGSMEQAKVQIRDQSLNELSKIKHDLAVHYNYNFASIDWKTLAAEDPFEYNIKKEAAADFDAKVRELHGLETALKEENARFEQESFKQNQVKAREEIVAKYPEFADKNTATPILRGITSFLSEAGFSKSEIEGIADARIIGIAYAAYKAKQAEVATKQAKTVVASKPKISATPPKKTHGNSKSETVRNRFEQSGSVEDAARWIEQLL